MRSLYNENDPFPVIWLRRLIAAGEIVPGDVYARSIAEITPETLKGRGQVHFFAGIGGWSRALRLAGWPDDAPIWTGSCPCQPFSNAGRGKGFEDERHLWPTWFRLIAKCRPTIIVGEQVASPAGLHWLDLVRADLEGEGYAFGAADLCAAGVGAPHIRQRLYFVALADVQRCKEFGVQLRQWRSQQAVPEVGGSGEACGLADDASNGREQGREDERRSEDGRGSEYGCTGVGSTNDCMLSELEYTSGARSRRYAGTDAGSQASSNPERFEVGRVGDQFESSGATRGFWSDAEWIHCRDGKTRPVEPGTFPLAHGVSGRVGRLCGYGNAIVPQVAAIWIKAVMEHLCNS